MMCLNYASLTFFSDLKQNDFLLEMSAVNTTTVATFDPHHDKSYDPFSAFPICCLKCVIATEATYILSIVSLVHVS